jgi:hypothetical protein
MDDMDPGINHSPPGHGGSNTHPNANGDHLNVMLDGVDEIDLTYDEHDHDEDDEDDDMGKYWCLSPHHRITTSPHHHITTSPHHHTTSPHHHNTTSPHHYHHYHHNHNYTTPVNYCSVLKITNVCIIKSSISRSLPLDECTSNALTMHYQSTNNPLTIHPSFLHSYRRRRRDGR